MQNVEIVTVHYRTPDLLTNLYISIRQYLGDIPFRVIDGSEIVYNDFIELEKKDRFFKFERLGYNIHHGNGMHHAITTSNKDYLLIIDSDGVILKDGLLVEMFKLMNDKIYAVGGICKTNTRGYNVNGFDPFILYLHPRCMLLNRKMYFKYKRFYNNGAPCIDAMIDIDQKKEYDVLANFNELNDYFFEKGRGTVDRYGYWPNKSHRIEIVNKSHPIINIPLRTSGRPNYFKNCINSIFNQTYKNINLIVSVDDDESEKYASSYGIKNIVRVKRTPATNKTFFDNEIGRTRRHAPYNLYLNELYKHLKPGYVVGLDDDDMFSSKDTLQIIIDNISGPNRLLFWRVEFPGGRVIPTDDVWGGKPVCCNFSGLGFGFSTNYAKGVVWDEWTLGDFRIATQLYNRIFYKTYINRVLTKVQRKQANGLGKRDDI